MSRKTGQFKEEEERCKKFIAALKSYWEKGVNVLISAGLEEEAANELFSVLAFTMFECGITLNVTKKALERSRDSGKLKISDEKLSELISVVGDVRETAFSYNS